MFEIAEGEGRIFWAATDGATQYFKGQIVTYMAAGKAVINGTVIPLAVPAGIADTTNFQIPAGIVIGFNRRNQRYTTVGGIQCEYDTGIVTSADQVAREYTDAEGMYGKNDPQVLVQVAEILPTTVIRGPFYNNAYGTVITELTHTSVADTTGMATAAATLTACNFTPVTLLATIYCRKGTNAGLYRVTIDTSTTVPDLTTAFPYNSIVGDTYVRVPAKQGLSYIYISGPGLYVNASLGLVTNYFTVFCTKLNLETAGKEYMEFRFANQHFDNVRQ